VFLRSSLLDLAYFDRVRSFRTLADLKADLVSFAELVELYVHELIGVEEEILLLSFARDKPETLVGETGDSSFLHSEMICFG
jgi:hypothetical protein